MANLFLAVSFFIALFTFTNACPKIIKRAVWNAKAPKSSQAFNTKPTHLVIHESESRDCNTQTSCADLVKSFQKLHMNTNGWADIGYNFLIGGDGRVYEGRGWNKVGAHAAGFNSGSIGICFMGTFRSSLPTNAALKIARDLINCGVKNGKISSKYKLVGHRQVVSTTCPGTALFNHIKKWSRWTANP